MKRILIVIVMALGSWAVTQPIDFGYVEWPGVTVKTHVAATLLESLGYETSLRALSVPIVLRGLAEGDLDVFMGVWRPSMDSMIEPYLEGDGDGSISLVARNLEPTVYRPAVPSYVAEEGITSLADVATNAELFDGRIYGIEPGNDGNEIINEMIMNDTYGFSALSLVESSTEAMLSAVERAIRRQEPIVFLAWSPHWMNSVFDITYLDDPEAVWGGDGYVATAMNASFAADNPTVRTFFERFVISPEVQSEWIDRYSRQGNEPAQVAREWVAENLETVRGWVEGLPSADGGDAATALESAFD